MVEPWRLVCGGLGVAAALVAVTGPLAERAHHDFPAHAVAHVLLAMLAPLLISLAAPVTLALRVLPVAYARRLARVLRTWPVRVLTEPAVAAVLSVGGMWVLYRTDLYALSAHSPGLHMLVHAHVFTAGYLFTIAIVGSDPMPHRRPYAHRAVVLVLALAAHDILAKSLYAVPPAGVAVEQAQVGAMVMYYGGDAVDLALAVILCARWYRAVGRRLVGAQASAAP